MKILFDRFGGMRPAVEPHLLQLPEAQTALNALLETGAIEGLPGSAVVKSAGKNPLVTMWRYPSGPDNTNWFELSSAGSVVRSPIQGDVWDRIYYTDSFGAKYGPASLVMSGVSPPGTSYTLGMPTPTGTPDITAFTAGVTDFTESRAYLETFVSAYDEEGPPSPVGGSATVDPRSPVTVSGLNPAPTPPVGKTYNITKRRLYRTSVTDSGTAAFQLVVELPIATLSYVDSVPQANLGKTLETEGYYPPPDGAYGMTLTESGIMVLLKGNSVYLSENYLPHAYDPENVQQLQFKAVAAAAFGQALVVMTEGDLYVGAGSVPSGLSLSRLEDSQACLSAAGVVVTRGGAVYPSPDGLVAVGTDLSPQLVTKGMLTQNQWLAYNPSSFIASMQNGKYHAWFSGGAMGTGLLIIDPTGKTAPLVLGTQVSGQPVTAAWRDPASDTLYIARNNQIQKLLKTGSPQTYTWRSKEFRFPDPQLLSAFVVYGAAGNVTVRTYLDGTLWSTKTLPTGKVGRLPTGKRFTRFVVEIESNVKITEMRFAPSVAELFEQ